MAKFRWFTGFEDGINSDCTTSTTSPITDGTARTGDYCWTTYAPTGALYQCRRNLDFTPTCTSNGDVVIARMQVAFRIRMATVGTDSQLFGFSQGTTVSPNQDIRVVQKSTGEVVIVNSGTVPEVSTGWVPTLGTWYVGRLHFQYERNAAGDPTQVTLQIYDGASMDTDDPQLVTQATYNGSPSMSGFILSGAPSLGSNVSRTRIVDYDDWWISVADGADAAPVPTTDLNWPTGSRVQVAAITGQGTLAQWTGNWLNCREIPRNGGGVVVTDQSSAAAGLQTTFTHLTAAELGLIPVDQLAAASAEDQEEAPPFSGAAGQDGFSSSMQVLTASGVAGSPDASIPVPTISSITPVAGAGYMNTGVWVRAFTIEWRSTAGGMIPFVSQLTASQFISASQYPNFSAAITVSFNGSTPADRFLNPASIGTSAYRRYGLGLLVTNAYGTGAGSVLLNPFGPSPGIKTTNLQTYGGDTPIPGNPFGAMVALFGAKTPNGTTPPYPATNPSIRPASVTFTLASPLQTVVGSNIDFSYVFAAPGTSAAPTDFPVASAVKVLASIRRASGTGTDYILIDGVQYPVSTNTAYDGPNNDHYGIDWTPRTAEEFDELAWGAESGSASSTLLANCLAEILTAGPCTRRSPGQGQYQQQCGTYTSNNGFQVVPTSFTDQFGTPVAPTAVFVKRIGTAATPGCFKAWWMGGTQCQAINSVNRELSGIMELTPDGFLLGPSNAVNGIAATYAYVAIFDGQEDTVNDAYMVTGSFQRQDTTDPDKVVLLGVPDLFEVSWTPDVVLVFGAETFLKTPDMTSPNSLGFNTSPLTTQGITAVGDGSFTTGTASGIGAIGMYSYMAFRFDPGGLLATVFQYGAFAGTGGTQVIPTNFQAEVIVLDHPGASYAGRWRSRAGNTGNNSNPWIGGSVTTTDITAMGTADFTVGAGASVSGQTSYWLAWKLDGAFGNTGSSTLPTPGDGGGTLPPGSPELCAGGGLAVSAGTTGGHGCTNC